MARKRTRSRAGSKAEKEFVSEAEEILERLRLDLADLDVQRTGGDEVDPDVINRLFRSAHSLKGLAGLFGFDPIHDLAHHLEDILDGLRLGRVSLDSPAIGLIDRASALFTTLLERVGDTDALQSAAESIEALVSEIEVAKQAPPVTIGEFDGLDIDPSLLRALTEYEEHRLLENLQRSRHILLVDSTFEIISFEEGLSELTAAIREVGEVLSTLPAPGEASSAEIRFSLLVASDLSVEDVALRLDLPSATVRSVAIGRGEKVVSRRGDASARAESAMDTPPKTAAAPAEARAVESLKSISETVRVDIRKLDELMNLVGEFVIQRGAFADLIARLLGESTTSRIGNELAKVHKSLDRKVRELQSAVLDVRLVPLRQVFEKVSRVVRRLRIELDKDVRLELRGSDTELDKLIVEELVDPLMHVVRNALDHAIEPADVRQAAGKNPQGTVRIDAFQRGNHVVIAVADDGAGVDLDSLRARAESLGHVERGEILSDQETLDLMFVPGVSTRSAVTETSGRGVGMDVVRHNLTLLGGIVDVESTPGRGSTISMTLPITLAIIQSLIVAAGGQRFAIPLNSVLETLLLDPVDIQRSEGRKLLNLRGEALVLRWLCEEFEIDAPARDAKPYVVVLGIGESRLGLVVEDLEGQQDTVIKPIQGPIATVRGIAGATELGGENPVLVLDVSVLLADSGRRREAA